VSAKSTQQTRGTAAPQASPPPALEREHALMLLRGMIRIRRFEEKCAELYSASKIRGFLHLYVGQEAIAVGAMQALEPDDAIVATYREHGHALLRGVSARAIMAEMFGKQEGCSRGRGGSMHLFDAATRFYGGNAIVGGGLPLAVGLGLADKLQGRPRITACFFGDGAVAEGEFHECMNMASLWKLPVLFCCENNLYSMGTALSRAQAETDLALKATGYAMPAWAVDGMDIMACEEATQLAARGVRAGGGPHFIEFRTYRFRAHSMFDPQLYRDKQEVEEWKKRDPIVTFEGRLREKGILEDQELKRIEDRAEAEIKDAVEFAEAGSWEPVEDLTKYVYSERPN
jgi:pyruvate dehydrogenase E1 component alpha subunit